MIADKNQGEVIEIILDKRRVSELKAHPQNALIYGENEPIEDLVQDIKNSGYVSALIITQDNVIVAGHRRCRACIELGIEEVEVIIRNFDNEEDILETIILENRTRVKTVLQKAHEAETLKFVETVKAKARQGTSTGGAKPQLVPELAEAERKGRVRDIVAEQVGFKTGQEADRAIFTAKAIKVAEVGGDVEKAEILKGQLERSPSVAEKLARNWEVIDPIKLDAQKGDLKTGKRSGWSLVEEATKKRQQKPSTSKAEIINLPPTIPSIIDIEKRVCADCGKEFPISEFGSGGLRCKECQKIFYKDIRESNKAWKSQEPVKVNRFDVLYLNIINGTLYINSLLNDLNAANMVTADPAKFQKVLDDTAELVEATHQFSKRIHERINENGTYTRDKNA